MPIRIRHRPPASTARAATKAAQDARIAAAVHAAPAASDQRIAAAADVRQKAVRVWRAAQPGPATNR